VADDAEVTPAAAPPRDRLRRLRSPWTFPILLVLMVVILGTFKVSGSSIGLYGTANGESASESGVIAGRSRPIRSDEWLVRTPWVLRQYNNDLASTWVGGMGEHEAALIGDMPTATWQVLVIPHTWYYHVFDLERAFAFEWQTWLALQLGGVYALVYALSRRIGLSVAAAVLVTTSPVTQWWTIAPTFTIVGYGCLGAALLIWAARSTSARTRGLLSVGAGVCLGAYAGSLYLPWQIGCFVVIAPILLGALWKEVAHLPGVAAKARRALPPLVIAGVLGVALFGGYAYEHREAVDALASTIYPGQRQSTEGGRLNASMVLSAPLDYFASEATVSTPNGTNQSENSSGLLLALPAALALFALAQRERDADRTARWPLIGAGIGTACALAWLVLPLPSYLGFALQLNRVPASRMAFPAMLASILLFVLVLEHLLRTHRRLGAGTAAVIGAVFFGVHLWGAGAYTVDGHPIDVRVAVVLLAVVSTGVALAVGGAVRSGLAVLVAFSLWTGLLINPIRVGLDPLTDNQLARTIDRVGAAQPEGVWAVFSDDAYVKGVLTASGHPGLAGISTYPDEDAWKVLDPELDDDEAWNRYGNITLVQGEPGSAPQMVSPSPDSITLQVDPCDAGLRRLSVRFVVLDGDPDLPCGSRAASVEMDQRKLTVFDLGPAGSGGG